MTAISACIQPLIDDNAVLETYAQSIIDSVEEYGPYNPHRPLRSVSLHASNSGSVIKTAICFMKCNTPVIFDNEENHQSRIFFARAANNSDEHLENMQKLVPMLEQEELIDALIEATSEEEFKKIIYG